MWIPRAKLWDTLTILLDVIVPTVAKGAIIRRPRVVALAEMLDLDRRAVRRLQHIRDAYAPGPLMLRIPFRNQAVLLSPEHVWRVLNASPDPYATATLEKWGALAHFEPRVALISDGAERSDRRRFNEQVLEVDRPMHPLAEQFVDVATREAQHVLAQAARHGELTWDGFIDGWFRMVRQVVFGAGARDDRELTDMLVRLRSAANWSYAHPGHARLRDRFLKRVRQHLQRAEPGSIAEVMAHTPQSGITAPEHQVPQWLFAFDPAAMATFRALALLATHPAHAARAREEADDPSRWRIQPLPLLRAAVLESLRLWPTTPMILRETTRETRWETGVMPAGTSILIFAPFFHRDETRLPYAHRFTPDIWLGDGAARHWPLLPFSAGPGVCPGQHVVLLLGSVMLAAILRQGSVRLREPTWLDARHPLPGTLSNYNLRFEIA